MLRQPTPLQREAHMGLIGIGCLFGYFYSFVESAWGKLLLMGVYVFYS